MKYIVSCILLLTVVSTPGFARQEEQSPTAVKPGEAIDFTSLAFYPDRWRKQGHELKMVPWYGEQLVFLTTQADYDPEVMGGMLAKLDAGWQHYAKLTGSKPRLYKNVEGKPTMAAVPNYSLTCGYGCGVVGSTGIELGAFYGKDYKAIVENPSAIPDYYYYEMGRNYYTFGDRHSLFVTGFAVFMRYVCVDKLELQTNESLRATIERAEAIHADSDMPFLRAFTTVGGLGEKVNRLKDASGATIAPTDQPVMYASAMLRLRRDYGGDQWVERFFAQLKECPRVRLSRHDDRDKQAALKQTFNWLTAASCAAGQDLTPVFADEWRMPLTDKQRKIMADASWQDSENLNAGELAEQLSAALEP